MALSSIRTKSAGLVKSLFGNGKIIMRVLIQFKKAAQPKSLQTVQAVGFFWIPLANR